MIDRTHPLPITRQAQIVNISRGSVYHENEPTSDADLKLMRRIDELHLELPFAGARMLRDLLRAEGFAVGRKHMTTLMRRMGITALYRKPNTSKRTPGHTIYPYLLRKLAITRSNHVWAMDITYIPMKRSKRRLRSTASPRSSTPTRAASSRAARSPGCWRDNVFIERVWRSIKYEEVYLHAYETVSAAREGICRYINFYNTPRPHSSHQARTPDVVYFASWRAGGPS